MTALLAVVLAYLCGSIPTGYCAGRLLRGIDLRQVGSGNPGTTNVWRVLGPGPAVVVFGVDALKGFLPVRLLPAWVGLEGHLPYALLLGMAAVVGHIWTIFLRWRGGKGVATAFGAFLAIVPRATLAALAIWGITFGLGRTVSVASLVAAILFPVLVILLGEGRGTRGAPLVGAAAAVAALVVYAHRSNIRRLLRGEEGHLRRGARGDR